MDLCSNCPRRFGLLRKVPARDTRPDCCLEKARLDTLEPPVLTPERGLSLTNRAGRGGR